MGTQPPPQKVAEPPIFGPRLLWPNGWMDQDGTWHGGGPWSKPHCVRWGTSSPPKKGGRAPPPIFGPFLLSPNGWKHQDATWYGCWPQPRGLCVKWRVGDPVSPFQQKGGAALSIFSPFLICPNSWMHQDATRYGGRPQPRRVCVGWGPRPPLQKSPILRVEVRISKFYRNPGTTAVVAIFVALEQQIILVKTRSESV